MTWRKRKKWDEKDYFRIFASKSVASQNLPIRCFYCSCLSSSSHHGRFDLSVLKTASGCSTCELGEVSMWPHVSRARLDMLNIVKLGTSFGILIGYWMLLAWLPFQARRVLIGVDVFRSPISHFDDSTVRDRDREGYWCSSVGINTPMQVFSWTLAAAVESCAWQQPFCTPSKRPGRKPKSAQSWSNYVRVMEWISLKLTIAVIPLISLWMVLSWPGTSKTDPSQLYSVC